ncbi:unnamed protein product [Durusdinium trenchii]|uniref:SCP domain-containing protein n=1 Tax=Durusdinium trenchii TaxID=1381693 RepID=A0ABP0KKG3_9DINO
MAMLFIAFSIGVAMADCIEPVPGINFLLQVEKQRKFARGAGGHLTNCGRLIYEICDLTANSFCSNNCKVHTHGQDCYRPVPEVMAEHPGMDGYCYFNQTALWVSPLPDNDQDFIEYAKEGILGLRKMGDYRGKDHGPLITFNFEGQVITSYMDANHYSYDDLYGYSLGYLQGQGLDTELMKNASGWIAISRQKCLEIQTKYNFQPEELVLADWLDNNVVISTKVMCSANITAVHQPPDVKEKAKWRSPTDCEPITARDFAKHHYIKCLLGYPNSASDGAYLNARACLVGNHVGHFTDCPYSPNVHF